MNRQLKTCGRYLLALASVAVFALPVHASDADGERGISVFDKHPECMERDELKVGDRQKCVVQGGPARVRVAPGSQASTSGTAIGSQAGGGAVMEGSPASGNASGSPVAGSSTQGGTASGAGTSTGGAAGQGSAASAASAGRR